MDHRKAWRTFCLCIVFFATIAFGDMKVTKSMFVLYVADQGKSRTFYEKVLSAKPVLDVPGMTEFRLSDTASIGLMPETGAKALLGDAVPAPETGRKIPRCEIYLKVDDPAGAYKRLIEAGGIGVSPPEKRPWGDIAAYGADPDGNILAFAKPAK